MVSDLNSIGTGYAQELGYAVSGRPAQAGSARSLHSNPQGYGAPEVTLGMGHNTFAGLWDAKSQGADSAKGAREAGQALEKVDALLGSMADLVKMVKNYPPFPPGNEERVRYLNSLGGLRKELQAMIIPPVADRYAPVFYPRESEFPELDAQVPSDAAVLAFGKAVEALQGEVRTAREALQAQAAQLAPARNGDIPEAPDEAQVSALSAEAAAQLEKVAYPISGGSDVLAQLGG